MIRLRTVSTLPLEYPATVPSTTPRMTTKAVLSRAMVNEMRAP